MHIAQADQLHVVLSGFISPIAHTIPQPVAMQLLLLKRQLTTRQLLLLSRRALSDSPSPPPPPVAGGYVAFIVTFPNGTCRTLVTRHVLPVPVLPPV